MEMIGKARTVAVQRSTLAWSELGEGEPLVLLHGLGDSHRTWRRVAPALAQRFRVLMPDLPGHGLSGRPDAPYTLDWYAHALAEWMDAIGLERAHIVGHSYGGGVAQWLLLDHRARVERLALVAAGGLGREVGVGLRLATVPVLGPALTPLLMRLGTGSMMRLAPKLFGNPEPEEIEKLVWMNLAPGSARAFRRTVNACIDVFGQHMQTFDRINEITSLPPLALFWGDDDRIIPLRHGERARDRLENTALHVFAGCGHYPHLIDPERFARELSTFLGNGETPAARLRPTRALVRRPHPLRVALRRIVHDAVARARRAIRRLGETPAPRFTG